MSIIIGTLEEHYNSNCPKRKQFASVVVAEDDTNSEYDIALIADGNTVPSDVWVVDT